MADIFLSYAREDIDKATHLAHALAAFGSVFWDRTIEAGTPWRHRIESELAQARCVVVAWSSASVKSHWVQE